MMYPAKLSMTPGDPTRASIDAELKARKQERRVLATVLSRPNQSGLSVDSIKSLKDTFGKKPLPTNPQQLAADKALRVAGMGELQAAYEKSLATERDEKEKPVPSLNAKTVEDPEAVQPPPAKLASFELPLRLKEPQPPNTTAATEASNH
ncbi:MAG: hypothetical protein LQ338_007936 [Usnochroma carphineum]|nr:MAG: hypothetical protein LQ338_007936 [Usnochroma carphineum]